MLLPYFAIKINRSWTVKLILRDGAKYIPDKKIKIFSGHLASCPFCIGEYIPIRYVVLRLSKIELYYYFFYLSLQIKMSFLIYM